jgi:hypothetical protein
MKKGIVGRPAASAISSFILPWVRKCLRSHFALAALNNRPACTGEKPQQTIHDQEPTPGRCKKLPAGKSKPTPPPVGPGFFVISPNLLLFPAGQTNWP